MKWVSVWSNLKHLKNESEIFITKVHINNSDGLTIL